ncbi:MAG: WYL domain-containing protein [Lachnospiraceae bacterium]|nr:WYL domain-containing protein [Lachnospiraceae bacterium]
MTLFSDTYNCYYQIMKALLQNQAPITMEELRSKINGAAYEESLFYIIPKIASGEWDLFNKNGNHYISKLSDSFYVPLTSLQMSYIKALLLDYRIMLFFDDEQLSRLQALLKDVAPLWYPDDFYYYDRFSDHDNYEDATYQSCFKTLISSINSHNYVDISYESTNGNRVHHHYLPCRLEYSIKNDKFRLLAVSISGNKKQRIETLNVGRMKNVTLLEKSADDMPDFNMLIRQLYYKEPVTLVIRNERNALERAMLQFANYKKNTTRIDDNTYECQIYYNEKMETELLIEVLSFGPMLEVTGSKHFLALIKERLQKQFILD